MSITPRLRLSTLESFAGALLIALGATPLAACGGGVEIEDGSGGGGPGSGGNGGDPLQTVTSTGDANPMTTGGPGSTSSSGGGNGGNGGGTSVAQATSVAVSSVASTVSVTSTGTGGGSGGCVNPMPLIIEGIDTGFDTCDGGNLRRREANECPVSTAEPPSCCEPGCEAGFTCSDSGEVACGCVPSCRTDADCDAGSICLCGAEAGQCVPATCATGSDCGVDQECTSWDTTQGCLYPGFACTTPSDSCGGDADCTGDLQYCAVLEDGHRECVIGGCAIGRPFLVDAHARTASIAGRSDWCDGDAVPSIADLDAPLRARIADAWEHIALMEHASIAAFARFALQLLSLGAPPELIVRTHDALRDETRHARLAFGLASHYRQAPVGPGALSIDGAFGAVDVVEIVKLTIREGCIGETVAALEAAEGEAATEDPTVRGVLGIIAHDERAHAELAWATVRWALGTFGADVRTAVTSEIAAIEAELRAGVAPALGDDDRRMARYGVTTSTARALLRQETLRLVVLPCLRGLLGGDARAARATSQTASV